MKIKLPIIYLGEGWRIVDAEIVDVADYREFTFAAHRTPVVFGFHPHEWTVTNIETGLLATKGYSKSDAIFKLRKRLAQYTEGEFAVVIRRSVRRNKAVYAKPATEEHK